MHNIYITICSLLSYVAINITICYITTSILSYVAINICNITINVIYVIMMILTMMQ